ncbi:HNH endonuclease [Ligilactobacillus sp. MP3]|uniref:HNH endonuclease signature motif containing protein n=1 Tax=Ligilactobacillus sp. MP3 TaxID=2965103 RepID=UPI00210DB7B1|nr:HNH endonuclease signature motif containing protein [Ligilactobacillus sp. MP3]MCQ4117054.1 HNH endonuclease [Ligilactobacillus sp. MP3]
MSKRLNQEIINWLKVNVPGRPWKEVFELFQKEFPDFVWTVDAMKNACYQRNIHNGILVSPESKKYWFKKGHSVHNEKPLGSEFKMHGYVMVKVKMDGSRYDRWKLKHVLIWEKHNGSVPKDCIIAFLDGNKENFDINNLVCVKKSVNGAMNIKSLRSESPELFKVRVAQIELDQKIKRITKNLGSD